MADFLLGIPVGFALFAITCGMIGWYYYRHPRKAVRLMMQNSPKKKAKRQWVNSSTVLPESSPQELPK